MANLKFSATASIAISGVTPNPVTAPAPSVTIGSPYAVANVAADDFLSEPYTINAGTTATAISLGKISAGSLLSLQSSGPVQVTLVQPFGTSIFQVDRFILLDSAFTSISVANAGGTAVQFALTVLGSRPTNSGSAGIF